ncbi:MAG: class I SAM-dependent methyltransferase [Saprospiraceae bacterium]|nr:class I SAM-dependent methyltransferase [Saprospiraceae bacterium]
MNNAAQIFNKHARWYQEQFMDVGLYHPSLDAFCAAIPKANAEVLELACGPGNLTRYVLEKRPDLRMLATDLAPNMLDLARENNPGAAFLLLDCRAIRSLGRRFDALLCGFALPYLSKAEVLQLVADAAAVLNPGGVFYLSAIEGDYEQSGSTTNSVGDTLDVYFYDYAFLEQSLLDAGFDVVYAERKEYTDGKGVLVADWMVVGRKLMAHE